jgi:uncharacterized protein (DUF362 family)
MDRNNGEKVFIYHTGKSEYPSNPPFHPSASYPEYNFTDIDNMPNVVYSSVRNLLRMAGLDINNFNTPDWNPLNEYIKPGDVVLLKPNLVKEIHPRDEQGWIYVVTNGSVIRAVSDYVFKALKGKGKVIVADAPQTDSSFEKVIQLLGLTEVQKFYQKQDLNFEIIDLRKEKWHNVEGVIVKRYKANQDPNGYVAFNLSDKSEFFGHRGQGRYYGADYDAVEVNRHHSNGKHEYLVAGTAIKCDVFINLPKLKTHKKTGITINLKNLVGVNADKNWLPHYTTGHPDNGGDQYPVYDWKKALEHKGAETLRYIARKSPKVGTWLLRKARKTGTLVFGDTEDVVRSGNWYGNNTVWRMCLDLNKIILYGNVDGTMRENVPQNKKRYLSFVDAIIAGEGKGPMNPDPVPSGIMLFGDNPANVDAVASVLMGFDPDKIPIVRHSFETRGYSISSIDWKQIRCISNRKEWNCLLVNIFNNGNTLYFRPHFGWAGHIENPNAAK